MAFTKTDVCIPVDGSVIHGDLRLIPHARGIVVFAHGSGSSRFSKRNQFVANILQKASFATFLFDLLTKEEEQIDQETRQLRFDIPLLAERLMHVTQWINAQQSMAGLPLGYFGASTGAAAALIAAAQLPEVVAAVVSRGGRPDLAGIYLPRVQSPTLLIVGQLDTEVITLNDYAYNKLTCTKSIEIIPGASHLFEEEGTLEKAAQHAKMWFERYL